jgi:NADH-quinone oxidoreductase subunit J
VILFWILAPIMVLAALGMVIAAKAVHSALLLAVVMICLAIMYAAQEAPFLFTVQVIVYTGAVLMLFLFVLMLVGVDASDSLIETIPGQRLAAGAVGLLFGVLVVTSVGQAAVGDPVGLASANTDGNIPALAQLLFSRYVFAFEVTSALLITAAVGAMVLAHRERLTPKPTQRDQALERMRAYAETGRHPGTLPSPGVLARHNAVGTPALLPDGASSELSVSRTLRARGSVRPAGDYSDEVVATLHAIDATSNGGPEEPTGDRR